MHTKFVIVGAPRTGTSLLVRTLNKLDGIRCHGELLGPNQVRGYDDGVELLFADPRHRDVRLQRLLAERETDPVGFIDRALTRDNVAIGFKALYDAFVNPKWRQIVTFLQGTPGIRFIHLTRTNSVRRFISEQIRLQGGADHTAPGGNGNAVVRLLFDFDLYQRRSVELDAQANEINALLAGQNVMEITYERFAADITATVTQVCRFLERDTEGFHIVPALRKVGATDLRESVINYEELLEHPATRELAVAE